MGRFTRGVRTIAMAAAALSLAGCGIDAASVCKSAGGTYVGSTCSRSSPREQAVKESCESGGGVFLRGQDLCAYGEGGP